MEILELQPVLKEILWGGDRLVQSFGMRAQGDNIAEAWMLSCHKDGACTIVGGSAHGQTLALYIRQNGDACLGTHSAGHHGFPLLIKLIDARDRLSVQVHPDSAYARLCENDSGKTEAWYILECDEGAELVYGFNRDTTREECKAAIENGTLTDLCCRVSVKPGDVVFIPAGTLHAIGGGILLAEVQQSSNVTYRVFDYNRVDKDGKPRALHVEKALDVLDFRQASVDFSPQEKPKKREGYTEQLLTACPHFMMTHLEIEADCVRSADKTSFVSLLVLDGEGVLTDGERSIALHKGSCLFVPAGYGAFFLRGKLKILETRV